MRIVVLSEHFTKTMGYIENRLPKAFTRLGHEVHVVTSNLQVYHNHPDYAQTYERFQGPALQPCGVEDWDGYKLHRLPHELWLGYVRLKGLAAYLKKLKPDIVQAHAAASWVPLEAALGSLFSPYVLFTGSHQTVSAFSAAVQKSGRWSSARLASDIRRALPGRLVHAASVKCYAATADCGMIAERYYGVPANKIDVCTLGVDTGLFYPVSNDALAAERRAAVRADLGFSPDEIVCVYSGRMTHEKNPVCLARAVDALQRSGVRFRALFIGDGPQSGEIRGCAGCVIHDFVPSHELPEYYRAADVGVWPAMESLSMLDAAGCGIPIVVSDRVLATERFEGNGLTYAVGDSEALARTLLRLTDPLLRDRLGAFGAEKIRTQFSWESIARRRLADYERVLYSRRNSSSGSTVSLHSH